MASADLFKTAPKEVTRYFEGKSNLPSFDWRDVAPEEHAHSFTVAKSAGFDILDDIRSALSDAISNNVPFSEFQRSLTPLLQAKGWWGKARVRDPSSGEEKLVQLGSPRRLRTIYWANTVTARAAGEWERIERNKAFLPFLVYSLSTAENKREEHQAWVGLVARIDDPIWDRLYPPNGWGCLCSVRQISRREAVSLGYDSSQDNLGLPEKAWINKRTGEVDMLPVGVDPGWDRNPGKDRAKNVSRFLLDRLSAMPPERQQTAIYDIVSSPILNAMAAGKMPKAFVPVAQLPNSALNATSATSSLLRLSADSLAHILTEHASRGLTVNSLRAAIEVAVQPAAIIQSASTRSLVFLGQGSDGNWWRLAAKTAAAGSEWWLTSFHRKSAKEAKAQIERARRAGRLVEE